MKTKSFVTLLVCWIAQTCFAQVADSLALQVASLRDSKLDSIAQVISGYEKQLNEIREIQTNGKTNIEKIKELESIQKIQEERIKALELQPRTRTSSNGKIAFNELFGLQEKLTNLDLLQKSRDFYSELQGVTDLFNTPEFKNWQSEYSVWTDKNRKQRQIINLISSSIKIVENVGDDVPLYGAISQTFANGVTLLLSQLDNKDQKLIARSDSLLRSFQFVSQFNQQRAEIDHEWVLLEEELEELKQSMKDLQIEQMGYYGIPYSAYTDKFLNEPSLSKKDEFRTYCNEQISKTHTTKEISKDPRWMPEVEVYMYRTQSLLSRYGQLAYQMEKKLQEYNGLMQKKDLLNMASPQVKEKLKKATISLNALIALYSTQSQSRAFIQYAPVMYISK
jgi:hypothetical protein